MTAPDPRLGEIAYRAQILLRCVEEAPNDSYGMDDLPNAIHEQRHDVTYLLTELRKRDDALARVEALHVREIIAVHEGHGEEAWCPACQLHWPCKTMAAVTAAKGDGGCRTCDCVNAPEGSPDCRYCDYKETR